MKLNPALNRTPSHAPRRKAQVSSLDLTLPYFKEIAHDEHSHHCQHA